MSEGLKALESFLTELALELWYQEHEFLPNENDKEYEEIENKIKNKSFYKTIEKELEALEILREVLNVERFVFDMARNQKEYDLLKEVLL